MKRGTIYGLLLFVALAHLVVAAPLFFGLRGGNGTGSVAGYVAGPPGYSTSASGIRNSSGGTVVSSSLTVAGANTMLVAVVSEYGSTISGVATSGSQNFILLYSTNYFDAGGTGKTEVWSLAAPTAGAQTVTATLAGSVSEASICVMLITNVATITAGGASYTGGQVSTVTDDVGSTTTNDLVGDGLSYTRTAGTWTATGTGQTDRVNANNPVNKASSRMSTATGASGTSTLSWSTTAASEYGHITFKLSHP